MSMYNLVFGQNEDADALLAALILTREDFYRYRDVFMAEDGRIAVYTRAGGNNREDGQGQAETLRKHPCYDGDADDDFDSTYCTFYFRVPEAAKALLAEIPAWSERDEAWQEYFAALRKAR